MFWCRRAIVWSISNQQLPFSANARALHGCYWDGTVGHWFCGSKWFRWLDTETVDGLSEDSDNSVLTGQLWPCDSRSEDKPKIHQFSAPNLLCSVSHQFTFTSFRLILTNVYRWTTEYQFRRVKPLLPTTHSRTGRQKLHNHILLFMNYIVFLPWQLRRDVGHDTQHTLQDYWWNNELPSTPVYSKFMKHNWFMHVMKVLHFKNKNPPEWANPDYDKLWKIIRIFGYLNNTYSTRTTPQNIWHRMRKQWNSSVQHYSGSTYHTSEKIWNKTIHALCWKWIHIQHSSLLSKTTF